MKLNILEIGYTFDKFENRLIKHILNVILKRVKHPYSRSDVKKSESVL